MTIATYVALFRGINVGGKNVLSMKPLSALIEGQGYHAVRTYIQSGNVVFSSTPEKAKNFPQKIAKDIHRHYGFEPEIMILSVHQLQKAVEANPYPVDNPKSLHLYLLKEEPKPDQEGLARFKSSTEQFQLIGKVFYLYAPDGIRRSKLAANVEKLLAVKATARNWNTLTKLLSMCNKG